LSSDFEEIPDDKSNKSGRGFGIESQGSHMASIHMNDKEGIGTLNSKDKLIGYPEKPKSASTIMKLRNSRATTAQIKA